LNYLSGNGFRIWRTGHCALRHLPGQFPNIETNSLIVAAALDRPHYGSLERRSRNDPPVLVAEARPPLRRPELRYTERAQVSSACTQMRMNSRRFMELNGCHTMAAVL
jgi:hypothetical protein